MEHYRTRRAESESSDDNEGDGDSEIEELNPDNFEETGLDPDEEFHIPEEEERDEDFDVWFTRIFPPMPNSATTARGTRRRRLDLLLCIYHHC